MRNEGALRDKARENAYAARAGGIKYLSPRLHAIGGQV
jgi:hypothetical protein